MPHARKSMRRHAQVKDDNGLSVRNATRVRSTVDLCHSSQLDVNSYQLHIDVNHGRQGQWPECPSRALMLPTTNRTSIAHHKQLTCFH
jgi:hypothetical protein